MLHGENQISSLAPVLPSQPPAKDSPVIGAEKLKHLYAMMLKLRLVGEHARRNHRNRQPTRYLEACEVASTIGLKPDDTLAPLDCQLIRHLVAKPAGPDLEGPPGIQPKREITCRLLDAPPAGQRLAIAAGAAFVYLTEQTGRVVVAFAQTKEIIESRASITYALNSRLPILYVQLAGASSSSQSRQRNREVDGLVIVPVDQADAVAIDRVAYEAIEKARRRAGPTLIRCLPYQPAAAKDAKNDPHGADPLSYMEHYLRKRDLWSDDFKRSLLEDFSRELGLGLRGRRLRAIGSGALVTQALSRRRR